MFVSNTGGDIYLGRDDSVDSVVDRSVGYTANIYASNAYPMIFWTNGSQRMRIASDGTVGIGTTTINARLQVGYGNSGPNTSGNMTQGVVFGETAAGPVAIQIGSSGTPLNYINSGYANNAGVGVPFAIYTGGTERMRILANGITQCTAAGTLGPYFRAGNINSVANNGTVTVTSDTAGGALVCVYNPGSGVGGVFWANYSSTVTKIAGDGEATDTGVSFAVYKSAGSHLTTFKNRDGGTSNYSIAVYSAYAYTS
jgi:hypothetical protein